jgi:Zn-dependent protease with chaperone function
VSIITGGGLGRHRDSASDAVLGWLAGGVIMLVLAAVMLLTNAYSRRRTRRAP